jgi:Uma2 family endonuclease
VISPDERENDLREKIDDYLTAGVDVVWVVDPRHRTMRVADCEVMREVQEFPVAGNALRLTSQELFVKMDRFEAQV